MELDASRLPDAATLDADICIVGAGPAGLALARELVGSDLDVLLLESGAADSEEWAQSLNEGSVVGDAYAGLRRTRHRQVGGTARIWNTPVEGASGAKYVPLDPWDFEPRETGFGGGWPIARADLDPFYRRAQAVAGLGPFTYDAADWTDSQRAPFPLSGDVFTSGIYQFGSGNFFGRIYPDFIRASGNVRLCQNATALRLLSDGNGRISGAEIGSRSGGRQVVRAGTVVLAGGAIENPRLLMVSRLGNGMVGRCFMEHPRDYALFLEPRSQEIFAQAGYYDAHIAPGGTTIGGRLALTRKAIREHDLPNASLTLLPRARSSGSAGGFASRIIRRVRRIISPPPRGGFGWSSTPDPGRVYEGFNLLLNLEHHPHPENRLILGTETDALGVPRPVLEWRWRAEEQAGLDRLRKLAASALEEAGLGRVVVDSTRRPDLNAHHHAGTTRMADDSASGVVDRNGRVHGTENLYVTGASCFPSAGFANPTLTILALALRLADHLKDGEKTRRR